MTIMSYLCRWLNSATKAESDKNFAAYYHAIGKLLRPTLERQLAGDKDFADDILNDMCMRLFEWLSKERPHAYQRIMALTPTLKRPAKGVFFERLTHAWVQKVTDWIQEAMVFCSQRKGACTEQEDSDGYALNEQHKSIKQQGYALLEGFAFVDDQPTTLADESDPEKAQHSALINNLKKVNTLIAESGYLSADEYLGETGGAKFITDTGEILTYLPKMQLPLKALLFTMANNSVKDFIRSKKKNRNDISLDPLHDDEEGDGSLLDTLADNRDEEERERQFVLSGDVREDFSGEVDYLLQLPIRDAEKELKQARSKTELERAEAKLKKRCQYYTEQVAIIELMGAGDTQETISEALGLTRDQVRYRKEEIAAVLLPKLAANHAHALRLKLQDTQQIEILRLWIDNIPPQKIADELAMTPAQVRAGINSIVKLLLDINRGK
jgi:DNA-directed RNA polymerase specialized sigma24 family protein